MGLKDLFKKNNATSQKATSKTKTAKRKPTWRSSKPKMTSTKKAPKAKPKGERINRIKNGRTVQTRDEFFFGQEQYRKPGYEKKGNYRKAVVVDSNKKNELALVKLTTSKAGKAIPGKKKSKYRPFVETKDNEGKPITLGRKFLPNPSKSDLSKHAVAEIKKETFRNSKKAKENRAKVRELKGRQKK